MTEAAERAQCPKCMDTGKDNLVSYKDGKYCYACGYSANINKKRFMSELLPGTCVEIASRGLDLKTCEHYNVRIREHTGKAGHLECNKELLTIYPIYESGKVVKQKIRSQEDKKRQTQTGDTGCYRLFGQNAFNPTKKLPIIITEGEYDAMCMYQETNLPAVSITRGSSGAKKELLENLEWLSQWREVLISFDMDGTGETAVKECIGIFEPGTVKNITLPLKDANEMVLANRGVELIKCIQTAENIRPSTIVFPMEIIGDILSPPLYGSPWPWPFMTKVTYGNRLGEVYMLAGDTSVGKTQLMYQIVSQHIQNGCKVGLIDLERQNSQTMQRIIGNMLHIPLHIPPVNLADFPTEAVLGEVERLSDKLALYRPESGRLTIDSILINIRYLAKAYGMTFFVLDNLTALSTNILPGMKEHEFASMATGQLVQIAKELNVTIFIINHLIKSPVQLNADITMGDDYVYNTNKEGLTFETGRVPELNNIYGGGKVTKLPDYLLVCSRNRFSSNEKESRTIYVKFLKTRFESSHEGHVFKLLFDKETGKLNEVH